MIVNLMPSAVRASLIVVAVSLALRASDGLSQGVASEAASPTAQTDVNARIEGLMKLGEGAHPLKDDENGQITHILTVGKSPLRKSLGVAAETQALRRAEGFATGRFVQYIQQKVTFYQNPGDEALVLTEGDTEGAKSESGKLVEKTQLFVTQQAEGMVRGLRPFSQQITDKEVVVALLWTRKSAAQTFGVADANNPPPPPKPRPPQETVKPRTVVNPDAEELLK